MTDKMKPGYVTESCAEDAKPCGLANQKEVCYSNAVLQCLSRLMEPHHFRARLATVKLGKREACHSGVDITDTRAIDERIKEGLVVYDPAIDFLRVLEQMQNTLTDVVHPYHFQAALAAKGGKRGEEFASGGGAYPYCWFRFLLDSLCEGTDWNGHPDLSLRGVVDAMCKVESMSAWRCRACLHTEQKPDEGAIDWGLRLDPRGRVYSKLRLAPTGVQQLVDRRATLMKSTKKHCTVCEKITKHSCSWNGLRLAPEILCVEIKTYERFERDGKEAVYEFLFSDIAVDEKITIPIGKANVATYALQSIVKIEGRGHEHAVAYLRSNSKRWWKCSDENITRSTFRAAQSSLGDEQVSMMFYRKLQPRVISKWH